MGRGGKVCPVVYKMAKQRRKRDETIPVIVRLRGREVPFAALAAEGLAQTRELSLINSLAGDIPVQALDSLAQQDWVEGIYPDAEVRTTMDVAVPAINADLGWRSGCKGKGINIAVVDTGIYPHPDLLNPESRLVAFHDVVGGRSKFYDDNGHGTHVAGAAAGNGWYLNDRYSGVAPEAGLVGVKVLDRTGRGRTSQVIEGIQWCVENQEKHQIRIINLSLGSPAYSGYEQDPFCQAVAKAWDSGIVVCCAAGNEGPDRESILTPGIQPRVITVGAMADKGTKERGDDEIASFSSRGPTIDKLTKPDVLAPGKDIVSLRVPRSYLDREQRSSRVERAYFSLSGTSMATGVCSGFVAVLLGRHPNWTPDTVKERIMRTAEDRGYEPAWQGKGYLNATSLLGYGC